MSLVRGALPRDALVPVGMPLDFRGRGTCILHVFQSTRLPRHMNSQSLCRGIEELYQGDVLVPGGAFLP
jgi:hypothetical protein